MANDIKVDGKNKQAVHDAVSDPSLSTLTIASVLREVKWTAQQLQEIAKLSE